MSEAGAFAGRNAPRLVAGSGIRQHDLGVVSGREYDGYVWAAGQGVVEAALVWGDGADDRATARLTFEAGGHGRQAFRLVAGATNDAARFELRALSGEVALGPPSLMPADNVDGMRRDTLALLKQLNAPIYRWPGGNFVSGYEWRDGVGDRDRRPPRKNPAWTGVEPNDFGTDEFLHFCRALGAEPMIVVNTGFGDAHSAAEWVRHCAGAVRWWGVGNEMSGAWQLGFMQLAHYVQKHNQVAEAMRAVDPAIELVAVGDLERVNTKHDPGQAVPWSQGMLEACAGHMTLISEHVYGARRPWNRKGISSTVAHAGRLRGAIRRKAEGHRTLQARLPHLGSRRIPVALDEWNYWHHDYVYGELGCVYDLADALGVAAGLHEIFRQSGVIRMAQYAQTVNVLGAIKTSRTAAEMETTGLVLQLYRAQFGEIPLRLAQDFGPLDVAAALVADGSALTIGVVNPTESAVSLALVVDGAAIEGRCVGWQIVGGDPRAHNAPGRPRAVDVRRLDDLDPEAGLRIDALGCVVLRVPLARGSEKTAR
jgi:alpha-N-arabinofuranosidase